MAPSGFYFNSQASCEARQTRPPDRKEAAYFNSQASCEARLIPYFIVVPSTIFQFPGLLRGPTKNVVDPNNDRNISIPRPLARPDARQVRLCDNLYRFQFPGLLRGPTEFFRVLPILEGISIPRPLARPDCNNHLVQITVFEFQFPGLLRGPTRRCRGVSPAVCYFNSQASCEARHCLFLYLSSTG